MSEKLLAALQQLDPANDNHWTADGMPRLDTVRFLAGDQTLTREAVTAAAPGLNRASHVVSAPAPAPAPAPGEGAGGLPPPNVIDVLESISTPACELSELDRALQALHEAEQDMNRATAHYREIQAEVDKLLNAKAVDERTTLSEALGGYFAAQQAVRDRRAAQIDAMRGVRLADVLPSKAKIDEAFQRRTGRGNKRPSQL